MKTAFLTEKKMVIIGQEKAENDEHASTEPEENTNT